MLNRVCSGREPAVEILRAIRHGVAAGACAIAARETGRARGSRVAGAESGNARLALHHAAALENVMGDRSLSNASSLDWARSRTRSVRPLPARIRLSV